MGLLTDRSDGWSRAAVGCLPSAPGVYRFRDASGRTLYVGRAVDLRRRVASYSSSLRDRAHLAPMVAAIRRVEAVHCDSAHEAAWLERNLLHRSLPPWNRTPGGQEVPVYVRLEDRPDRPGLTVVHSATGQPGEFGPYLGGEKVRLAVSALHRVLPLPYAGTGLTGLQRDLADKRGVGPADLGRLVERLTAVLRRDPAAVTMVRERLGAHLDAAVAELAFERAARLQVEIDAVGWLTDPQRVTRADERDLDLAGWADGILVRFEVRAGRLSGWAQRACSYRAAAGRVAATPADWVAFADRNAALAARINRAGSGTLPA